ncbi:protein kinase domain-containing protein [Leptolyngbya sp. 7M]|uniref:protein kinase domain-containing protein n=1 Tax=Leptolyngbya sp. 7M TaxID=2812896 RepID=UPI001B8C5FB1|nr:protein kinase [Leptolyngbya sp. 7M]QYO68136.1 protein kinase [Leptolyngbya sp. 7M]
MIVCLDPTCTKPVNPDDAVFCQTCGHPLQLGDRFQAVKLIGQGGFGRTFLAIDRANDQTIQQADNTLINRDQLDQGGIDGWSEDIAATRNIQTRDAKVQSGFCIIKQLLPLQNNLRESTRLFQQEAAQLAKLGQHPQIPKLLTHIEQETALYLVQEYVAGQNLEQVLATQGVFSEAQIRKLLADLLPVLRFIHSQQVVHRDIKPANIIWPSQGERFVLVDFGAAKSLSETVLTQTGTTIGSAGYAAPEQAMGKATFASDLYSLGVTCVHLLTGVHPFDLYSISEDRWVWRQYLTQPISLELRRVLDKLLQRATSQRYDTATAVLQDLRLEATVQASPSVSVTGVSVTGGGSTASLSRPLVEAWRCVQTLTGHQGEITALAVSPDGELIASSHQLSLKANSASVLVKDVRSLISEITGLQQLLPDAELYAGGISLMNEGCYLNPHLDNSHDKSRTHYRVLNLLYYVTPDWQESYGGNLELWDQGLKHPCRTIYSKFNRLVIMATNKTSWHSVSKIRYAGRRCCINNYYFSPQSPDAQDYTHVTSFRGRPDEKLKDTVLRIDTLLRNLAPRSLKNLIRKPQYYKKQQSIQDQ